MLALGWPSIAGLNVQHGDGRARNFDALQYVVRDIQTPNFRPDWLHVFLTCASKVPHVGCVQAARSPDFNKNSSLSSILVDDEDR